MSADPCGCDLEANHLCAECTARGRVIQYSMGPDPKPLRFLDPRAAPTGFILKDSGARQEFASGMVRDITTGKMDYSLVLDGPMFERWAELMRKGAEKYAKRNWMQANGQAELDRFNESAFRHFMQWRRGDTDEDHAAAVLFNINGAEYVKARMAS